MSPEEDRAIRTFLSQELGLIERARLRGDTEAFTALVRLHQGRLRAFLLRLCQSHDVADDLAQETFIKAYQQLNRFSGTGKFSSWLFTIAYRVFLENCRQEKRRHEVTAQMALEPHFNEARFETMSAEQRDLEKALAQLSAQERALISLCHSYGFSHAEAASVTGLPLGTIKSSILRGKQKLRSLLTENYRESNSG